MTLVDVGTGLPIVFALLLEIALAIWGKPKREE